MPERPVARVLPSNEYRRVRWRNGLGWTREIHVQDPEASDGAGGDGWQWRASIAEIEQDGPFSRFDGVDRILVLVGGNGVRLRFDDGEVRELLPPHDAHRFAGERAVSGELVDGPTHDFNLMWRRDAFEADLWHRPLVGPMVVFVDPGTSWLVHLLAGDARIDGGPGLPPMAGGDTALLEARDARRRYVLDGGGEVLIARLVPR
ncbi:HutD/Ves family protein [Luteimonas pelagia]